MREMPKFFVHCRVRTAFKDETKDSTFRDKLEAVTRETQRPTTRDAVGQLSV